MENQPPPQEVRSPDADVPPAVPLDGSGEDGGWSHDKAEDLVFAAAQNPTSRPLVVDEGHSPGLSLNYLAKTKAPESRRNVREKYVQQLDGALSIYEELYDVNPGYFAGMPTDRFMEILKNYDALVSEVNHIEDAIYKLDRNFDDKELGEWETGINGAPSVLVLSYMRILAGMPALESVYSHINMIKDMTGTNMDTASDGFYDRGDLQRGILRDEQIDELERIYIEEVDSWTHTGEQSAAGMRTFISRALEIFSSLLEEAKAKKQEFISSFNKEGDNEQ